ncbi:MAG: hypothetical protein PHX44_08420 [Sulfurimonas sp.]|uniref:hypothetical protein n=1 Tax=Sulfurimonas sp. TaxID=2022749 RepID=UPI00262EE53B|nr:hypothetical protein [Sulfurimonas sp.]MDD2653057.1 hypothetical protein [Sulfurimonas sp.]MDD3452250.1 hypothetical protein [Sulfurimonas sp.]
MNVKKALIFAFFTAFLILGTLSMQRAMPEPKEDRIYIEIKAYSPYLVEKRIGGLTIVDKRYDKKEKPNASDLYHRLDELEKLWGREFLRVEGNEVLITNEKGELVGKVLIENQKEREFLKNFFGI